MQPWHKWNCVTVVTFGFKRIVMQTQADLGHSVVLAVYGGAQTLAVFCCSAAAYGRVETYTYLCNSIAAYTLADSCCCSVAADGRIQSQADMTLCSSQWQNTVTSRPDTL